MVDDQELAKIVSSALSRAEQIWVSVKEKMEKLAKARLDEQRSIVVPTSIPGYAVIDPEKPAVDDFVAFMIDIRNSTTHLRQAIRAKASQLPRVFFETTALFAAVRRVVDEHKGSVVEYLGDGALALFRCTGGLKKESFDYSAYDAAVECMNATRDVVNKQLFDRYELPALEVGIGLSYSKAVVTTVGEQDYHPKIIGECVYQASRLCKGRNEIAIDEHLQHAWPKSDDGPLRMTKFRRDDVDGYVVHRSDK